MLKFSLAKPDFKRCSPIAGAWHHRAVKIEGDQGVQWVSLAHRPNCGKRSEETILVEFRREQLTGPYFKYAAHARGNTTYSVPLNNESEDRSRSSFLAEIDAEESTWEQFNSFVMDNAKSIVPLVRDLETLRFDWCNQDAFLAYGQYPQANISVTAITCSNRELNIRLSNVQQSKLYSGYWIAHIANLRRRDGEWEMADHRGNFCPHRMTYSFSHIRQLLRQRNTDPCVFLTEAAHRKIEMIRAWTALVGGEVKYAMHLKNWVRPASDPDI